MSTVEHVLDTIAPPPGVSIPTRSRKAKQPAEFSPDAGKHGPTHDTDLTHARVVLTNYVKNPPQGSVTIKVDRAMARAMLERNDQNRPLSERSVETYEAAMKAGEWVQNGESIKFTKCGLMFDGQHRLQAVVHSGVTIVTDARFGLDKDAFSTLDIGRKRTPGDVVALNGRRSANQHAAVLRALWRYQQTPRMTSATPTNAALVAFDDLYGDQVEQALLVSSRGRPTFFGSTAAAFVTVFALAHNKRLAEDFLQAVNTGVGLNSPKHPAVQLRNALIKNATSVRKLPSDSVLALTVKAWNAFATGAEIHQLRWIINGDTPESFPVAVGADRL